MRSSSDRGSVSLHRRSTLSSLLLAGALAALPSGAAVAKDAPPVPGTTNAAASGGGSATTGVPVVVYQDTVNGGCVSGSTCITFNGPNGPDGGTITFPAVPADAQPIFGFLYFQYLTNTNCTVDRIGDFAGATINGVNINTLPLVEIGCLDADACFGQIATHFYRVDVSTLFQECDLNVATFELRNFGMGNSIGTSWVEGATLMVAYCSETSPVNDIILVEDPQVRGSGVDAVDPITYTWSGFLSDGGTAELVLGIGNGQPAAESVNFTSFPSNNPTLLGNGANDGLFDGDLCNGSFYDNTIIDVSAIVQAGDTMATFTVGGLSDCLDSNAAFLCVSSQNDPNPCTPDACIVSNGEPEPERAHPGWNYVDNAITLTANEPTYWSALTGQPKGVSPFTVLDPGTPPGRPAMDGSTDRVLRGYVVGWAVDQFGNEIKWNHLKGEGTIVNYRDQAAWEYNTWTHQAVGAAAHGDPLPEPGVLRLDGAEYSLSFDELLLNFQAAGSDGFSGPMGAGFALESDTDLTLHPPAVDVRQNNDGPITTKASMDIWNENETKFSGTHRCITCWDQTLISRYDAPNSFLYPFLQTDHGKARVDGHAANECNVLDDPDTPEDESVTSVLSPLLGVHARLLSINSAGGCEAISGSNLFGLGTDDTAIVRYDASGGGGPPEAGWPKDLEALTSLLDGQRRGATAPTGTRQKTDGAVSAMMGPGQDRVSGTEKGSLFYFTKVEIRWTDTGTLVQDTFLSLTNDYPDDVRVQMYFINGDPPLEAAGPQPFESLKDSRGAQPAWTCLPSSATGR